MWEDREELYFQTESFLIFPFSSQKIKCLYRLDRRDKIWQVLLSAASLLAIKDQFLLCAFKICQSRLLESQHFSETEYQPTCKYRTAQCHARGEGRGTSQKSLFPPKTSKKSQDRHLSYTVIKGRSYELFLPQQMHTLYHSF